MMGIGACLKFTNKENACNYGGVVNYNLAFPKSGAGGIGKYVSFFYTCMSLCKFSHPQNSTTYDYR